MEELAVDDPITSDFLSFELVNSFNLECLLIKSLYLPLNKGLDSF